MQGLLDWVEKRIPAMNAYKKHLSEYPMPKNFNFWYLFGSLAMLVLVNQILTGIWLTMNYVPSGDGAFASVEYIMRDVEELLSKVVYEVSGSDQLSILNFSHSIDKTNVIY
ncbi:MAG: hypothetical protein R3Y30_17190, partial [Vibrio sp.]